MCSTCSVKLYSAFDFKSTCLYVEDKIISYINPRVSFVDLKEVYLNEYYNKVKIGDDQKICRLCLQSVSKEFVPFYEVKLEMIHRYIPEVYIGVTEDPVVCRRCFDSLNVHDNFIKTCLDVEKQTHNINNNKVAGFKPSNSFIKNGNDETELEEERQMKRLIKIEKELKTEEMLIKTEEIDLKSEGNDWESDSFLLGSHNETVQNKMRHIYKEEADIKREYMLKCETIEVQISKPEAALHTPYNSENKNELNGGLKEEAALDMCCKESSSCLQLISKTHLEQERINVMCLLTKLSTRVISECIS